MYALYVCAGLLSYSLVCLPSSQSQSSGETEVCAAHPRRVSTTKKNRVRITFRSSAGCVDPSLASSSSSSERSSGRVSVNKSNCFWRCRMTRFGFPTFRRAGRSQSLSISSPYDFEHVVHVSQKEIRGFYLAPMFEDRPLSSGIRKRSGPLAADSISPPYNFEHVVNGRAVMEKVSECRPTMLRRMTEPADLKRPQRKITARDISAPSNFRHVKSITKQIGSTVPVALNVTLQPSGQDRIIDRCSFHSLHTTTLSEGLNL